MASDSNRWSMSGEEIAAHLAYLARIGISDGDVRAAGTMMTGMMGDGNFPIFSQIVPLLPVGLAISMVAGERRGMEIRPHMYVANAACLIELARFYDLAAVVMNMRAAHGEADASRGAEAMREHARYLVELGQRLNIAEDET
ncbi:hypothetical protein [Rhizobium sp. BK176]|uniref:hypothetical protein n=1 Tax=Rhizobium sp. BK176 TaxID=2587071 RepID=UPI0021680BEC|nr:hypothetical protein [Rhizobium sp. BK176]MCS4088529.1 hypothetical protein [Rhizobium sp. BK176]